MDDLNVNAGASDETPNVIAEPINESVEGDSENSNGSTKLLTDYLKTHETTEEDQPEADDQPAPEEPEKPADQPDKADTKVEAKDTPVDDDEDEDRILSTEEIEGHKTAPKPLRAYADRVSRRLETVEKAMEQIGGIKGLERVAWFGGKMLDVPDLEGKKAMEIWEGIRKLNPEMADSLNTALFYGSLDTQPELLENFVKANMGEEWTMDDLKVLAEARTKGHLDLEDLSKLMGKADIPDDVRRELDDLKKFKEEQTANSPTKEQQEAKTRFEAAQADQKVLNEELWKVQQPFLSKYQFLPADNDPDPVKQEKLDFLRIVHQEVSEKFNANPFVRSLVAKISRQTKGEDFEMLKGQALTILKGLTREVTLKWNPRMMSSIKALGQVSKQTEKRRPEPSLDSKDAGGKITAPEAISTDKPVSTASLLSQNIANAQRLRERGAAS